MQSAIYFLYRYSERRYSVGISKRLTYPLSPIIKYHAAMNL